MKICIQSGLIPVDFGLEKGYALYREAGFEAIDWNIDTHWDSKAMHAGDTAKDCIFDRPTEEIIAFFAEEAEIIKKNGLAISQAHAPFPAYVIGKPEVLDYTIGIYQKCIRLCAHYGCKNLVIHGISLAANDTDNTPEDIDALNRKLYEALIPTLLEVKTVTVCLENLFTSTTVKTKRYLEGTCSDPHQAVAYIDALNEKAGAEVFGLCMDTGHLNLLRKNLRTYVPILGKRIKALHIHDNDGASDAHMAPYTGTVDWRAFYTVLREIGYEGDLDFETVLQTKKDRLDPELVPAYLRLIAECGRHFRNKILEK